MSTVCGNLVALANIKQQLIHDDRLLMQDTCLSETNALSRPALARQLAWHIWKRDGTKAATDFIQSALKQSSNDWLLLLYLSFVQLDGQDYDGAVLTLQQLDVADNLIEVRGERYLDKQEWLLAAMTYEVGTRATPSSPAAWHGLARAYYGEHDLAKSLTAYRQAVALKPIDDTLHFEVAQVLLESGDMAQAIEHLRVAVTLTPEQSGASLRNILSLIRNLRDSGLQEEARQTAELAVSRFPDSKFTYFELGEALRQLGQTQSAIEAFKRSIQFGSDYSPPYFAMGLAYLDQGDARSAMTILADAVRLDPKNNQYRYWYGRALQDGELPCQAASEYWQIMSADPTYKLAGEQLQSLLARNALGGCGKIIP